MIKNFKEYKKFIVFNDGTIYKKFNKYYKLVGNHTKNGYKIVTIGSKQLYVHRIVAECFIGKSELTVDHINGNKFDNRVENLEYVTSGENVKRAWGIGLHEKSVKNKEKQVLWNNKLYSSATELSLKLGLSKQACSNSIKQNCRLKGHYAKYVK